jgi:hypothetical protein
MTHLKELMRQVQKPLYYFKQENQVMQLLLGVAGKKASVSAMDNKILFKNTKM